MKCKTHPDYKGIGDPGDCAACKEVYKFLRKVGQPWLRTYDGKLK